MNMDQGMEQHEHGLRYLSTDGRCLACVALVLVDDIWHAAALRERERAAKIVDDTFNQCASFVESGVSRLLERLAAAIRESGK